MGLLNKLKERLKLRRESVESFEENELDDMGPGNIPKGARNE